MIHIYAIFPTGITKRYLKITGHVLHIWGVPEWILFTLRGMELDQG